jgi:hypothetical protein
MEMSEEMDNFVQNPILIQANQAPQNIVQMLCG